MNGCLVNPAEMYKKEIAALTEELARERERSKAARQDFETEQAELKTEQAKLKTELARRELVQAELKKDLDEERHLRKEVERNAQSVRQDLETELAKLRDTLAKRELEQAGHISILRSDGPGLSPNEPLAIVQRPLIPDGKYAIKNRAKPVAAMDRGIFWNSCGVRLGMVYLWSGETDTAKRDKNLQVNNHSPIIQVIKG